MTIKKDANGAPAIPDSVAITGSVAAHMDARFLSSYDLIGMKDIELTISRVELAENVSFFDLKARKETLKRKSILVYFEGAKKPLVLNVTNTKTIIEKLGTNKGSEWIGKKITLYVTRVKAFGASVNAIRVK